MHATGSEPVVHVEASALPGTLRELRAVSMSRHICSTSSSTVSNASSWRRKRLNSTRIGRS